MQKYILLLILVISSCEQPGVPSTVSVGNVRSPNGLSVNVAGGEIFECYNNQVNGVCFNGSLVHTRYQSGSLNTQSATQQACLITNDTSNVYLWNGTDFLVDSNSGSCP